MSSNQQSFYSRIVLTGSCLLGLLLNLVGCGRQFVIKSFSPSLDFLVSVIAPENKSVTGDGSNSKTGDDPKPNTPGVDFSPNSLFTLKTVWTQPNMPKGFDPVEPYTPLVHFNESTFYVWVASNYRPYVTQITRGIVTTSPLDSNVSDPYTVTPDGHYRFSLGVDKLGYVHVTGDMRHYSIVTEDSIEGHSYLQRYQKQTMLYWKSNQPLNIASGFAFAGGRNASTAMPGGGWMAGRFFTDNQGELYYSSHVHAYEAQSVGNRGQNAVGLYKYDTNTQKWTAFGGLAETPNDPDLFGVFPVLFWENSGMNGGWFQNYQARFQFDSANRLHFTVAANTNSNYTGADRVFYAVSSDGGLTWSKANGKKIPKLPLRGIDGPNQADVVADSGAAAEYLPPVGLAIDKNGSPAVAIPLEDKPPIWYVFNGTQWTTQNPLNIPNSRAHSETGFRTPTNDLVFVSLSPAKVFRTSSIFQRPFVYDIPGTWASVDEFSLRKTGVAYGLSSVNSETPPEIVQASFTPAPLPCGWLNQDVTGNPFALRGSAAFQGDTFTLYDFMESGIEEEDSLHFSYLTLKGDGMISARVALPKYQYSQVGVMIRESLSARSRTVGTFLSPELGISMRYRSTEGKSAVSQEILGPQPAYFLRLQRSGNLITSFISVDGTTWKQAGQVTLSLPQTVYIGLFSAANRIGYSMETATFNQVKTSVVGCSQPSP